MFAGNLDSSDRLLTLINQKLDTLAQFPSMGRRRTVITLLSLKIF
ncbi:hypothetical protein [Nostoc sp. JL23]